MDAQRVHQIITGQFNAFRDLWLVALKPQLTGLRPLDLLGQAVQCRLADDIKPPDEDQRRPIYLLVQSIVAQWQSFTQMAEPMQRLHPLGAGKRLVRFRNPHSLRINSDECLPHVRQVLGIVKYHE